MKVTGIGGGHGLAATLRAAQLYANEVAAVVTVADDGGSSGRLTDELQIPAPGDIRNCLVALAGNKAAADLFQHRFVSGALTGHTVGNLVIAALAEMDGDFASAVERAGELLEARGSVYPATTETVSLTADVDGGMVRGQVAVAESTARIRTVCLDPPNPPAHPGAARAILDADQVVLGPGSLYTSLIATLVVPGIREALVATKARRVLVCNARMQEGETQGLDAAANVEAVMKHAGRDSVDVVVVQSPAIPMAGTEVDVEALQALGVEVVEANVAHPDGVHKPSDLATALSSLS